MKVLFLGTGTSQGVPMANCNCHVCLSPDIRDKRLRPSVLVEVNSFRILIDAGPDLRLQLIKYRIDDIDAILLTHYHMDHIGGIDEVRPINFLKKKSIPVYGEKSTLERVERIYDYCFSREKYPGVPEISLNEITLNPFKIGDVEIVPVRCYHYILPVLAFRIGEFAYVTDAKYIPPEEIEKIKGVKVLVVNALRKEEHISHFTFNEAINFIREVKPEKAYLTHISHQLGRHIDILRECPENIEPAYDGLTISI